LNHQQNLQDSYNKLGIKDDFFIGVKDEFIDGEDDQHSK